MSAPARTATKVAVAYLVVVALVFGVVEVLTATADDASFAGVWAIVVTMPTWLAVNPVVDGWPGLVLAALVQAAVLWFLVWLLRGGRRGDRRAR